MNQKKVQCNLMLIVSACIWGFAFVAQSIGLQYVGAFTFNSMRSILGGLVLVPCIFFLKSRRKKEVEKGIINKDDRGDKNRKTVIVGGLCCGIALFIGSSLQQVGLKYTTVGKAGFITALYIIIVPIMGIFIKKKVGLLVWISVVIALIGMYLLCVSQSFTIGKGDILIFLCATTFSVHILIIDYFSPKVDGILMSCIQFFVCGIISLILMFFLEKPAIMDIVVAWKPICYAGILSCGVAYTFQILGQKHTDPVVATLILSMESVIAVFAGWLLLGQVLSFRESIGSLFVFCAIMLAQVKKVDPKEKLVIAEE